MLFRSEMFTRLMEEAIAELKGQPLEEEFDPEVIIGTPAFLPEDYVPDTYARLGLYRRLAGAAGLDEVDELRAEMRDRFGPIPEEAHNLSVLMEIKVMLRRAGARRLEVGPGGLSVTFGPEGPANYERVMDLVMDKKRQVRLSPSGKLFVGDIRLVSGGDLEQVRDFLPSIGKLDG